MNDFDYIDKWNDFDYFDKWINKAVDHQSIYGSYAENHGSENYISNDSLTKIIGEENFISNETLTKMIENLIDENHNENEFKNEFKITDIIKVTIK